MAYEAVAAVAVGLAVLWLALGPLIRPAPRQPAAVEPLDPEETPKGVALTALKEIEFDRETGKLSDADYEQLKAKYTSIAIAAMRAEAAADQEAAAAANAAADSVANATAGNFATSGDIEAMIARQVRLIRSARSTAPPSAPVCASCGPRPEPDALFCSSCGARLRVPVECARCGAPLPAEGNFCESCGSRVAA